MKEKWETEKRSIQRVQKLREEIEQVNADIERAQREYDLNKAAELQYGKLPEAARASWPRRKSALRRTRTAKACSATV